MRISGLRLARLGALLAALLGTPLAASAGETLAQPPGQAGADTEPEVTQPVQEAMPSDLAYGEPIRLAEARRALAAAEAEAERHKWKMNCAVVEPAGDLVAFEKMDGANYGSIEGAQDKARSAARWRRSTKVFFDSVQSGNAYVLALGPTPVEGGFPIVVSGKVIGGIGCGGGFGNQAATAAKAGRDAVEQAVR